MIYHSLRVSSRRAGILAAAIAAAALGLADDAIGQLADLVVRGGTIIIMDEDIGRVEALAAAGDTILAVGNCQDIDRLVGPSTTIIELGDHVAVPGLIDGHAHLAANGGHQSHRLFGPQVISSLAEHERGSHVTIGMTEESGEIHRDEDERPEHGRAWPDLGANQGKGELVKDVLAISNTVRPDSDGLAVYGIEDRSSYRLEGV